MEITLTVMPSGWSASTAADPQRHIGKRLAIEQAEASFGIHAGDDLVADARPDQRVLEECAGSVHRY